MAPLHLTDLRAQRWIEQQAPIPDDARAALCQPDGRVHAELFEDGFVIVLADLATLYFLRRRRML